MREFLQDAWAYTLALVLYGVSFALMLLGAVMAWLAAKDVAAGEDVIVNLIVAAFGLSVVGAGVLVGLTAPRMIRKLLRYGRAAAPAVRPWPG